MKEKKPLSNTFFVVTGFLLVFFLTLLDQLTKYFACTSLKDKPPVVLIKGVLSLQYLENRGMAFGMFQGRRAFLLLVCLAFFAVTLYVFVKIPRNRYYLPFLFLVLVLFSGAMGNFIDRLFRGYVVDFIYFCLIDFPIFNLADIYVVCSCILWVLFIFLKYQEDDFSFLKPGHKG